MCPDLPEESAKTAVAQVDLRAAAHRISVAQNRPGLEMILGADAGVDDAQWARVSLAAQRHEGSVSIETQHIRRLARFPWGDHQEPHPPSVREATVSLVRESPAHRTDEDLHPHRLDTPAASLDRAMARRDLAKKNEAREARDA